MSAPESRKESADLSVDFIIGLIRDFRNSLIKRLLIDENLTRFIQTHYNARITPVRIAFLKRELQELSQTPLDLVHYSKMIIEMKDSVSIESDALFYQELDPVFNKYCS